MKILDSFHNLFNLEALYRQEKICKLNLLLDENHLQDKDKIIFLLQEQEKHLAYKKKRNIKHNKALKKQLHQLLLLRNQLLLQKNQLLLLENQLLKLMIKILQMNNIARAMLMILNKAKINKLS